MNLAFVIGYVIESFEERHVQREVLLGYSIMRLPDETLHDLVAQKYSFIVEYKQPEVEHVVVHHLIIELSFARLSNSRLLFIRLEIDKQFERLPEHFPLVDEVDPPKISMFCLERFKKVNHEAATGIRDSVVLLRKKLPAH